MLDTHKASMGVVVVPLTVGVEACPFWSLKVPVPCHPYHIQCYSVCFSGNLFCSGGQIFLLRLESAMGREFCEHLSLQCPASPHLKQIPSVFTAATNA